MGSQVRRWREYARCSREQIRAQASALQSTGKSYSSLTTCLFYHRLSTAVSDFARRCSLPLRGVTPPPPHLCTLRAGFNSFAHLPHYHDGCLGNSSLTFDLAVLGAPFDTLVSFRPGARFGPYGIRSGSRRQRPQRGYHPEIGVNPYEAGVKWLDCGDVTM